MNRRRWAITAVVGLVITVGGWYGGRQAWGAYHWRRAHEASAKRDFALALDHLRRCRSVWPDSADVSLEQARAARRAGRMDDALDDLRACPRTGPLAARAQLERLLVDVQQGHFAQLEEQVLAALASAGPDDWPAVVEVATGELMRANRLLQARDLLDEWARRQPDDAEPWLRRGWVLEHLHDNKAARADYEQVLALQPDRDPVRLRVAELLVQGQRGDDALAQLDQLRRPDAPAARLCRARALALAARTTEAVALLDALLHEAPDDGPALAERGRLASVQGDHQKAAELLRRAHELLPYDRDVLYNLLRCLERGPRTAETARLRAQLDRADDDRKRLGELMQEVMARPRDPALRCQVARIFLRNGLAADGRRWLETALEVDPANREALEALAQARAQATTDKKGPPIYSFEGDRP